MRIALTGAGGFLGWHVRCRAFALGMDCVVLRRDELADPDRLVGALSGVDAVVHCAGVNRGTDADVTEGNVAPARVLADAVRRADRPIRMVYANSVQSRSDCPYGVAKRQAADLLAGPDQERFSDVVLPNLYGEHGRPHYNSFVATFCHQIAAGRQPVVEEDRPVPLLHAQDAAEALIGETVATGHRVVEPPGEAFTVSEVLREVRDFDAVYRTGELPDLTDRFRARLFNTYRSYLFPGRYPIVPTPHTDARGELVECVRAPSGGQAFVSSTAPDAVRGEHVHLRKLERFVVVAGTAEIAMRRLFTTRVVRFQVAGARPVIVDAPTMWLHRLTNTGNRPVIAFFWASELYRPDDADTYPGLVDVPEHDSDLALRVPVGTSAHGGAGS